MSRKKSIDKAAIYDLSMQSTDRIPVVQSYLEEVARLADAECFDQTVDSRKTYWYKNTRSKFVVRIVGDEVRIMSTQGRYVDGSSVDEFMQEATVFLMRVNG